MVENFLSVSGVESTRDCRPEVIAINDDEGMENVFPLGDIHADQWWPPISANYHCLAEPSLFSTDILKQDQRARDNGPLSVAVGQELGKDFGVQSWLPQQPLATTNETCGSGDPVNSFPAAAAKVIPVSVEPMPTVTLVKGKSKDINKGVSMSAPSTPKERRTPTAKKLGVQKTTTGKRPADQRESHIWSERQRRKGMNHLFATMRSLLPRPAPKTDKSTIVLEIIKYIQTLEVDLEMLTKKRQQIVAARTLDPFGSTATEEFLPNAYIKNGLTLVDRTNDSSALTAVTALPPPGSGSCLQSYLGANVGLHVCGLNVFITMSSPRGQQGLFHRLLVTIYDHQLDVINATISTSSQSIFHCLHCQALQGSEVLKDDLHSALQSVISTFCSP